MVRSRAFWWIQLAYLSAFAATALALIPILPETAEQPRIERAAIRFESALNGRDWEEVWSRCAGELRENIDANLLSLLSEDDGLVPADGPGVVQGILRRSGRTREELLAMAPRERFIACQRASDQHFGIKRPSRSPLNVFRSLFIPDDLKRVAGFVAIDGSRAYVIVTTQKAADLGEGCGTGVHLVREQWTWRVRDFDYAGGFGRGERKLAAFLPCRQVKPKEFAFVIEAGGRTVEEADAVRLASILRSRAVLRNQGPKVLLCADPDLDWQGMINLIDAPMRAGIADILFARPGPHTPARGLRVNGVILEEITEDTILPPAAARAAIRRHMSILAPD